MSLQIPTDPTAHHILSEFSHVRLSVNFTIRTASIYEIHCHQLSRSSHEIRRSLQTATVVVPSS